MHGMSTPDADVRQRIKLFVPWPRVHFRWMVFLSVLRVTVTPLQSVDIRNRMPVIQ